MNPRLPPQLTPAPSTVIGSANTCPFHPPRAVRVIVAEPVVAEAARRVVCCAAEGQAADVQSKIQDAGYVDWRAVDAVFVASDNATVRIRDKNHIAAVIIRRIHDAGARMHHGRCDVGHWTLDVCPPG